MATQLEFFHTFAWNIAYERNVGGMNKLARYITIACGIAVAAFLVWFFSSIVWYLVISMVISLIGKPLVTLMTRLRIGSWRCPSALAAAVTLLGLLGLAALFCWGMVPLLASQFDELKSLEPSVILSNFQEPMNHVQGLITRFLPENMRDFSIQNEIKTQLVNFFDASFFTSFFSSTASLITSFVIALFSISFISFYFLKEEKLSVEGITFFFPARYEENIKHAMQRVTSLLLRYFVGLIIESIVVMVLTTLGVWAMQLPFNTAVVIGLLAGILNVIPYVGALIALALALIIAAAMFTTVGGAFSFATLLILVVILFLAVRMVDNFFLQPYIYASSANATPLEIFIILLMAGQIAGVVGMLLAIPAYTVIRVFAKEFFNNFHMVQRLTKNI